MTRSDFATTRFAATRIDDMPSERTVVTELATGLGMLGQDDLAAVIASRPGTLSNLTTANWNQPTTLWDSDAYQVEFATGFLNGKAFLAAPDALNGRHPRVIEWTGPAASWGRT